MSLNSEQRKIILLSSVGGLLEFYDFTLYGLFSVYFAPQFFPSHNVFLAIIASYSVFILGYLARPLGGIIFSHLGDEIGRKTVLILTMLLMGITSLGLGLLPTYATIGIFAPILMIVLRLTQGLAIGGELPSTIVYATEFMPTQRGIAIGTIFAATIAGLLLGTLLNLALTHIFTSEQLYHFGWRIPFLLGAVLCLVAYKVRRQLHETAAFSHLKKHFAFPLQELLQHHLPSLLIGIGLVAMLAAPILLALIFMPTYLTTFLGFAPKQVSLAISVCTIVSVICTYLAGCLADRFGASRLLRIGLPIFIVCAGACYFMLYKSVQPLFALPLFAMAQGALISLPLIILSDLFPTSIRLTGVALSYNIAFVLFGGLIPITMTGLIEYTQRPYSMPFIAVIVVSAITLGALQWYIRRTK